MKDEMVKQEVSCKRFMGRKAVSMFLCMVMVLAMAVPSFAAETTPVTAADWASVITNLETQISVSTVVGVLATIAAACVGLVFMWWGVRKATHALMAAFRKGKISI